VQHVDPTVGWDDPDYTRPPVPDRPRSLRWLAVAYVVFAAAVSLLHLWSISVPGVRWLAWMASFWGIAVVAVVWMVAGVVTLVRLVRGTTRRIGWYLLAVPAIGLVVLVCRVTEAPLRVRFEPAREEFTAYAEQVLADAEGVEVTDPDSVTGDDPAWNVVNPDVPLSIGGFRLSRARVLPQGVVIFDANGALFDDAGFAYLPDGSFPAGDGSFESPDFRSLGGGWYAFTSSW
jgi:hypothetical protein